MQKVYAVRDVKADCYGALICCPTRGIAMRTFVEACRQPGSHMAQYREDFNLYELGIFDPVSGTLAGHPLPEYVMSAVEALDAVKVVDAAEVKP